MENKYLLPEMQIAMQTVPMQTAPMQTAPMQESVNQEMVERARDNLPMQLVYPEIFYKLQPFVILVCDEFERYSVTPTQQMIDEAANGICAEACRIYPDLMYYSFNQSGNDDPPFMREFDLRRRGDFDHDFFMRRFRRRGNFHDLVSILLLSEIFRRL